MVCKILSYKGNVFGVEPPTFVTLEVTKTDPGFKCDTATNATKPATLETGAEIRVPLFIDEGEMINIDTRKLYRLYLLFGIIPSELTAAAEKNVWFLSVPVERVMELL